MVFSSVQSLSPVWRFATPWTAARQASLSITSSRSLLESVSIESASPNMKRIHMCVTESLCYRAGSGVASALPLPCTVWVVWEATLNFPSLGPCGSFFMDQLFLQTSTFQFHSILFPLHADFFFNANYKLFKSEGGLKKKPKPQCQITLHHLA